MSEVLSYEQMMSLFQETHKLMRESTLRMEKETEKLQKKEAARKAQEALWKEENEKRTKALNEQMQETDRKLKSIGEKLGDLGNRLGEFVEHMVKPAAVRLFQERGIEVHEVHGRSGSSRNGKEMEVDLLVVNDGEMVAVECKSRLTKEAVLEYAKKMENFKMLFPTYKTLKVYGAVAGIVVDTDAAAQALQNGLFLLVPSGEIMEIRSPQDLQAREF